MGERGAGCGNDLEEVWGAGEEEVKTTTQPGSSARSTVSVASTEHTADRQSCQCSLLTASVLLVLEEVMSG